MEKSNESGLIIQELVRRENRNNRRLRLIEQRIDGFESRISSLDQLTIKNSEDLKTKLTDFDSRLKALSDRITKIENSLEKTAAKLEKVATKKELEEVENMFELLNPIGQGFVTRDELDRKLGLK